VKKSAKNKKKVPTQLGLAKKYELYIKAVQSPDTDVLFYQKKYHEIRGRSKKNLTLREDFCGTGIISTEWVKLNKNYQSVGVDLDPEPLSYGQQQFVTQLTKDQQSRIRLVEKNVLDKNAPKADIIAAVNFSYFLFKKRELLKQYFTRVYETLNKDGLFIVDIFGGSQCMDQITDRHQFKDFTYYWHQKNYDPITHYADFAIHFKYQNKMYNDVFTYDWRMWGIAEIQDLMMDVGFLEAKVYWEGTTRKGTGNGIFTEQKQGESCESWIAYIAGVK
jgi:SAM-dependent methyltransferase